MGRCPKDRGVALKFFSGDGLTWDDVFDRHGGIVMQNRKTPLPSTTLLRFGYDVPQGGEAKTVLHGSLTVHNVPASGQDRTQLHTLSFRSPQGASQRGKTVPPKNHHRQGEVPCASPPHSLS